MAQPTDSFIFNRGITSLAMGTGGLCLVGALTPEGGTGWIATVLSGAVAGYIGAHKNFPTWCGWAKTSIERILDINKTGCALIMAISTGYLGWKISSTNPRGIVIGTWGLVGGGYFGYTQGATGVAKKVKDVVTNEKSLQQAAIAIASGLACFIFGRFS